MKIFLDDVRNAPDGTWRLVRNPDKFAQVFYANVSNIEAISFDHDLGWYDKNGKEVTGYDCLVVIEHFFAAYKIRPPKLFIHSANAGARKKMELAIEAINRRGVNHKRW